MEKWIYLMIASMCLVLGILYIFVAITGFQEQGIVEEECKDYDDWNINQGIITCFNTDEHGEITDKKEIVIKKR